MRLECARNKLTKACCSPFLERSISRCTWSEAVCASGEKTAVGTAKVAMSTSSKISGTFSTLFHLTDTILDKPSGTACIRSPVLLYDKKLEPSGQSPLGSKR